MVKKLQLWGYLGVNLRNRVDGNDCIGIVVESCWKVGLRHQPSHQPELEAHTIPAPHTSPKQITFLAMSSDESVGGGGGAGEPKLKKRRTDDREHDGPVEDEETARKKMKEAGFDPDDVTKECELSEDARDPIGVDDDLGYELMHPITYFCRIGDLKMFRYLLSKGASTTTTSTNGWWFPMYTAAIGGHLDVCKWLYNHGAEQDVGRRNGRTANGYSPLSCAVSEYSIDRTNTSRWFILKGVLSLDDKPGIVDPERMRREIQPERIDGVTYDERPQLLEWAKQSVQTHSGFMAFLLGTLPAAVPTFSPAALRSLLAERLQSQDAAEML